MSLPTRLGPALAALTIAIALPACRTTPEEIQRIETENELLREQIQSMRLECEQYRKIDIGVDKPARQEATPGEQETPAPP